MAKKRKNKIRILDPNQDLNNLFKEKPGSDKDLLSIHHKPESESDCASECDPVHDSGMSDKEFAELLEISLKGKNMNKMLQEKKERGAPKKVPLSKRLKKYPPPESKLDLHGFTSDGATIKADSYIRNAFRNGLFTIKIIVGKGIHSEFGAVLPGVIEDLLVKLKNSRIILHFAWERKSKTRSGAIIVYLNQFND